MMRKNPRNLIAIASIIAGGLLVSTPAHAWNYLSGYGSHGGYGKYYHPSGHYKRPSTSVYSTNPHANSTRRKAQAKAAEKAKLQWYNENPPCGTYGRLPERCKTSDLNVADRD